MSVRIQLSDKRGDAILVVEAQGDNVQVVEEQLAAAAGLVGLGAVFEGFGAAGPATVPAVTSLIRPQGAPAPAPHEAPVEDPWGIPPVPPMQQPQPQPQQQYQQPAPQPQYQQPQPPQQPQMPAAAAPSCQHGPMVHRSGVGQKGPWAFWGCPAPQGSPDQCPKQWIR